MIILELTTESGSLYVANVVHKRVRRIDNKGQKSEWFDYKELHGGYVGEPLTIDYPDGINPTITTPIVKINFAHVD